MIRRRAENKDTPVAQTEEAQDTVLLSLCQGDRALHAALRYFLYLRPEDQIARLGNAEQLVQKAAEAIGSHDPVRARVDYEDAAWIEMYLGNTANVKHFLEVALDIRDGEGQRSPSTLYLNTLLLNLEKVMTIARRYYYKNIPQKQAPPLEYSGGMPKQLKITVD